MRIGVDMRMFGWPGVGRYTQNLVDELMRIDKDNEYVLFLDRAGFDNYRIRRQNFCKKLLKANVFSFEEQYQLLSVAGKERLDVLHCPHFVVPFLWRGNLVVTIHDLIPFVYPETLPSTAFRIYCHLMMRWAARKSEKIIAPSYHTKQDILKILKIPEAKVKVIYEGVSEDYYPVKDKKTLWQVREKYKISEKFIFYTGQWKPHKNIPRLIRAFDRVKKERAIDHQLVIGGRKDPRYPEIAGLVRKLGLASQVVFTGYIAEQDLPALYSGAELFVFPSLYEGFGLPILEAMACGTPVVTSNTSSLSEVAGEAAILVNPYDVQELAKSIEKALFDEKLKKNLVTKGIARAKLFSWEKTAGRTLRVYEETYAK